MRKAVFWGTVALMVFLIMGIGSCHDFTRKRAAHLPASSESSE